jgi:hypothetical protein
MKIDNIKSSEDFMQSIMRMVKDKNCEYTEAVMIFVEQSGMEIETAADLIKQNAALKTLIYNECAEMNLVKKTARLLD